MRIGFDVAQTCGQRAGCSWYADALVREMVRIAPTDQFFLYHQFGGWVNESTAGGTVIDLPNSTSPFLSIAPRRAARVWQKPNRHWRELGAPEVVHANCFQAPELSQAKLVWTIYDLSFWAVPEYTTESNRVTCQAGTLNALERADGFIFISESARSEFERMLPGWLQATKRAWIVTPLAARPTLRTAAPLGSRTHWLAVGSLEPRKNFPAILDAMERYWSLSSLRLPLWIAGGMGWKSETLRTRIDSLTARGVVRHVGYVGDEQLSVLYTNAQALVFPSWYEGFGLPVVEAMATGCPVITSNRTSLPEIGGDAALYVEPTNVDRMVELMLRIESDGPFRAERVQLGLAQAGKFTWEKTARQTLDFYHRVLTDDHSKDSRTAFEAR